MSRLLVVAAWCAGCLWLAAPARGVIIDTTSGSGNTSAPADDPGWANVGLRGIGTGVYLGNRWVLTAGHVGAGSIDLSGTTYALDVGTAVTLNNAGASGKSTNTDLVLFQITTDPGLAALSIASSTPANGSAVTMIGSGLNRGAFTTWVVNTGTIPFVWTQSSVNPDAAGYQWGSGRTMRWGTNTTSGTGWLNVGVDAFTIQTTFNDFVGESTEGQAATGDSGGGVFRKNGGSWELAGIMLAVDSFSGQPGSTSVFGNKTYIADLAYYQPQIAAIVVPEPAFGGLAIAGVIAVAWWRRRVSDPKPAPRTGPARPTLSPGPGLLVSHHAEPCP
ncbi:MAG: serine protease [Planctomycetia bacterium]|nr:serine protease [Planctomycetia bacterium]